VVLAAPPLLVMAGALLGVGVVIAIVAARAARGRRTGARRSRLGARLATLGAPPVALVGAQFAFPSDRTRGARSTRAGIAGVTIAVVATIAALTFSAGLGHLLATPALRGQTFDAYAWYPSLETPDGEPRPVPAAEVERFFAEQEAVDVATFGAISFPGGEAMTIGDRKAAVPLAAFDVGGGAIEPAIVSGRAPRERSEIALGEATQAELHVSVGDTVEAHGSTGDWETRGRRTSASFVVVGTAVYPVQGSDEGLGRGAFVTLEGARALYPHAEVVSVFIRLASGGDLVRLAAEYELAYPHTALVPLDELSHVVNALEVQQVDATPLVLAGIVALMAIGVLCNMLFGVVRAHRRDLAVLAALGMRPPQLRRAVAVSASLLTLLALAIGVPVGLALGRTVWLRYARSLHVVRVGVVPWFGLFEVVLTALVLANLAAFAASFVSSRAAARSALRTE
jgi:ABC-type lipoprotein release transport system permease subunit